MSAATQATPRVESSVSPVSGFGHLLRSEWTKIRSVRSTYWSLFAAVVATVGVAALICSVYIGRYSHVNPNDRADFNPTQFSLNGLNLAQLAVGVLGVLVISGEYGTGMIRATFTAVPQRRRVLAAKAAVFAATAFVVGTVASFVAYFVGQAILAGKGLESSMGDPGVLRAVIGGGLYLAVLGLLALGLGAIIRVSAGAISALFGVLFVLPVVTNFLPSSWQDTISPYLPSEAGRQIFLVRHEAHALSPWGGFGVFCLYAAISLAVAAVLITRRDA